MHQDLVSSGAKDECGQDAAQVTVARPIQERKCVAKPYSAKRGPMHHQEEDNSLHSSRVLKAHVCGISASNVFMAGSFTEA